MQKFCIECGNDLPAKVKFCIECGTPANLPVHGNGVVKMEEFSATPVLKEEKSVVSPKNVLVKALSPKKNKHASPKGKREKDSTNHHAEDKNSIHANVSVRFVERF